MMLANTKFQSRAMDVSSSITRELANAAMGVDGMIPLWFGEPNQPTPKFICDGAARALNAGETFYSEGLGRPFLREAIATYMTNLYDRQIARDRIAVTVSGGNAINLAFQSLLQEGDTVAILTPTFPNLFSIPALQGANVITHSLELKEDKWVLDIEAFLERVKSAKVVLINSPSNPTGFTLNHSQMTRIMQVLRARGTWLISDEVYARIVFDGQAAPSFLEVSETEDRLIVVNSFSKSWAMTGWRLGWLTLPPSMTSIIEKITEFSIACAPPFSQRAGLIALKEGDKFITESNVKYRQMRDLVCAKLNALPNVICPVPEAAFYAFFKVEGVSDSITTARNLIDTEQVGLAPGDAFLLREPGWFRLCFAQSPEQLNEALNRISRFF